MNIEVARIGVWPAIDWNNLSSVVGLYDVKVIKLPSTLDTIETLSDLEHIPEETDCPD